MDPILEEMKRVKDPRDIRYSRFLDWVDYLCALASKKDDEIATLKAQIEAYEGQPEQVSADQAGDQFIQNAVKRGPGRPRKEAASV